MVLLQSYYVILICGMLLLVQGKANSKNTNIEDQNYWRLLGDDDIQAALSQKFNTGVAKNVILFVGDGMGLTTITASRIYDKSEKGYLSFEKFPNIGVLKTYNANKLVPDSCSTATALFCGVKANHKTAGVDATVGFEDCEASLKSEAQLESIINWAQEAGKSTGFVTTTRVTHATPSALYAHTPNRKWECESIIPSEAKKCKDIARQLIENTPGKNINVIMGGGRQCLVSDVKGSEADPIDTWSCHSKDGRNLIDKWKQDKINRSLSHAVITNNEELANLNLDAEFVLGVFANGHLQMEHARDKGPKGMPSLTNMTLKAIQLLQKNENGFLLVVEGGLIDFAHHRGHARQALGETVEFSNAIRKASEMMEDKISETLIIVTSDHSHSLAFSGYPERGSNILGVGQKSKLDGVGYTALLYATGGPDNYQYEIVEKKVERLNPELDNTTSFDYAQQAAVLTDEVTHGGTDVLVYAKGPMSHLFNSVHEQTYVAYVISYSAKIGLYRNEKSSSNQVLSKSRPILLIITVFMLFHYCL